eukprot:TRINITY_DN748_c0_g1_i3.p1 TRINITY_DN748_c0_g1~~TRINITY_DN748_c0_g1_i3.p1  ORF type:complete len:318 (+),score=52.08 TRINITY_DN748_c0_g1_i3:842-1795(+)
MMVHNWSAFDTLPGDWSRDPVIFTLLKRAEQCADLVGPRFFFDKLLAGFCPECVDDSFEMTFPVCLKGGVLVVGCQYPVDYPAWMKPSQWRGRVFEDLIVSGDHQVGADSLLAMFKVPGGSQMDRELSCLAVSAPDAYCPSMNPRNPRRDARPERTWCADEHGPGEECSRCDHLPEANVVLRSGVEEHIDAADFVEIKKTKAPLTRVKVTRYWAQMAVCGVENLVVGLSNEFAGETTRIAKLRVDDVRPAAAGAAWKKMGKFLGSVVHRTRRSPDGATYDLAMRKREGEEPSFTWTRAEHDISTLARSYDHPLTPPL